MSCLGESPPYRWNMHSVLWWTVLFRVWLTVSMLWNRLYSRRELPWFVLLSRWPGMQTAAVVTYS